MFKTIAVIRDKISALDARLEEMEVTSVDAEAKLEDKAEECVKLRLEEEGDIEICGTFFTRYNILKEMDPLLLETLIANEDSKMRDEFDVVHDSIKITLAELEGSLNEYTNEIDEYIEQLGEAE